MGHPGFSELTDGNGKADWGEPFGYGAPVTREDRRTQSTLNNMVRVAHIGANRGLQHVNRVCNGKARLGERFCLRGSCTGDSANAVPQLKRCVPMSAHICNRGFSLTESMERLRPGETPFDQRVLLYSSNGLDI
ncbi:Hypothetical predicted protein [Mytilus galloprovincialis]|uniref:Uncharacterized protein n=1 Tax=Mytilus galloprovincialis TaxID=29158 RepID=A0A8B6FK01_MYTGA|nr:Hypothetical predicted protein [Mytilus galloprovincialis]